MAELTFVELVSFRRYRQALDRLNTHPEEVAVKDAHGRTALWVICQERQPGVSPDALTVVQAMLELKPELVHPRHQNCETMLLLNLPKVRRSTELTLMLIQADPSSVSFREKPGRLNPFHTACSVSADIVVLEAMLRADPSVAASMTSGSTTPMDLLLRRNGWDLTGPGLQKVALILLTAYKGHVEYPLPMQNMVHAVCLYPRPLSYLTRIMKLYPEQPSQRDEDGFLPLHYAVKHVGTWDDSKQPFVHCNFLFQKLMKLVKAAPQALWTLDPQDGLYPALVAATRANESSIYLDVTFQLLRASPEMIAQAIVEEDEQK